MAIDFNGVDDAIYHVGTAPVTAVPLTLFCRARWDTIAQNVLFHVSDANAANAFYITTFATNQIRAVTNQGATFRSAISANDVISTGTWFNVCAVFTSTTSRAIWLNGTQLATNGDSATPTGIDSVCLGTFIDPATGLPDNNESTNGQLADAAAWNAALGAAEIASLNNYSPAMIRPASLRFYAPLIREIIDVRGTPLTTVNAPVAFPHPRVIMPSRSASG